MVSHSTHCAPVLALAFDAPHALAASLEQLRLPCLALRHALLPPTRPTNPAAVSRCHAQLSACRMCRQRAAVPCAGVNMPHVQRA
eukprot:360255-Chlamydomonas_euryale.AAC.15